jgi:hypothetical protein
MVFARYSNKVKRPHVKLLIQLKFYNVVWEEKKMKKKIMNIEILK